jgi:hypothetical protein
MESNASAPVVDPFRLSEADKYSRLFRESQSALPEELLHERLSGLGASMFDDKNKMPAAQLLHTAIHAGYTYFGQFIAHDLTFDDTPFRDAGIAEAHETKNFRTPWLDLDSVYGDGPGSNRHGGLYASDNMSFVLGETNSQGVPYDVPLHNGRPMVADCRNCENAIIRQLHAIFLALHNLAVQDVAALPREERFRAAQQRVRWQYQWLVREKFLAAVCTKALFDSVRKDGPRIRYPNGQFSIPVEFAHAAGRFGHSLVRQTYQLVPGGGPIPLFRLFSTAHESRPLPPDVLVKWRHFFGSEESARLDRRMADPFGKLSDAEIHPFVNSPMPHDPHSLPIRTLRRGAAMKLATGQQVRDALDPQSRILPPDCDYDVDPWDLLESFQLADETPLWYYVLLEAELNESGTKLGAIGGRLVAEIIESSLRHDPSSFLNHPDYGANWKPPLWRNDTMAVLHPAQLAVVVGLERAQT